MSRMHHNHQSRGRTHRRPRNRLEERSDYIQDRSHIHMIPVYCDNGNEQDTSADSLDTHPRQCILQEALIQSIQEDNHN